MSYIQYNALNACVIKLILFIILMPIAHRFEYVKVIYHRAVFFLSIAEYRWKKVHAKIDIAPNQLVTKVTFFLDRYCSYSAGNFNSVVWRSVNVWGKTLSMFILWCVLMDRVIYLNIRNMYLMTTAMMTETPPIHHGQSNLDKKHKHNPYL